MKKLKPILNVILFLIVCLSLNSCLSVDRKIKLNRDGSGEEVLKITFMKEFYSMMSVMTDFMDSARKQTFLDSLYNDDVFISKTESKYDSAGVKLIDISSSTNYDSSKSFIIKYSFDSISKIGSLLENTVDDDADIKAPAIVTLDKVGNEMVFNYIYEMEEPEELGGGDDDTLAAQMKASIVNMFGSGFLNFEIEFPYEVVSSNASSANGNTLTWNYPLSEIIMKSEMKLEAVMK